MRSLVVLLCACSSSASAPSPTVSQTHTPAAQSVTAPTPKPVPEVGDPTVSARVVEVRVVGALGDGVASDQAVYARADQPVTLYAVLIAEHAGKRVVFSDAQVLQLGGKKVAAQPIAKGPAVELRWNRIEPAVTNMTNGDTPAEFHWESIDYRATPIDAGGRPAIAADVRPTLTPDYGKGVGTMRFQIVALQGDRVIASAGPEARRGKASGGLTDAVMRVSVRRDDTYLGFLTEMYGQPYIWASAGTSDGNHQSEHLEGSDCADFVIYGKRRAGVHLPYTWTGALPQYTSLLAGPGTRGEDGVYRDAKGQPLPFSRAGDILLFPRHVGVLTVDRGTLGVLDDKDVMMHTLFDTPHEQPIGETSYADKSIELRRFKR